MIELTWNFLVTLTYALVEYPAHNRVMCCLNNKVYFYQGHYIQALDTCKPNVTETVLVS